MTSSSKSFDRHPKLLTLDVDAFDDPAHGQQQKTFSHGYYHNHQHGPIVFTSAEDDAVLLIGRWQGTIGAALGADDDMRNLAARLRAAWPDLSVDVRGDDGFGVPGMHLVLTELGLIFTFGLGMNSRVNELSNVRLAAGPDPTSGQASHNDCLMEPCIRRTRGRHRGRS